MKRAVSPAVAVVIIIVVVLILALVGWQLFFRKGLQRPSSPKSPEQAKILMEQKGMTRPPTPVKAGGMGGVKAGAMGPGAVPASGGTGGTAPMQPTPGANQPQTEGGGG